MKTDSSLNRWKSICAIALTVLLFSSSRAQTDSSSFIIAGQAGYTSFSLPQTRGILNDITTSIRYYHINAQPLLIFPANLSGGCWIYIKAGERFWLRGGIEDAKTRGVVGYSDVNGKLVEDVRVNLFFIKGGAVVDIFRELSYTAYVSLDIEDLIATRDYEEKITFTQFSYLNSRDTYSDDGNCLVVQPGVGVRYSFLGFVASAECGYHFNDTPQNSTFVDDFYGWSFSASLGIPL